MSLIMIAIVPPLFLMFYIYKKDKIEHEPFRLVFRVFLLGVFMMVPILIGEIVATTVLDFFLYGQEDTIEYILIDNILCVGLIEEAGKYMAAKSIWNEPDFNYRFDAIVYTVAASLGFAAIENVLYVSEYGLSVGITRALLSIPSHATDGIFMGIYFGEAKMCEVRGDLAGKKRNLRKCLLLPIILHGVYDALLSFDSDLLYYIFIGFVIVVDLVAYRMVKKKSKSDIPFHLRMGNHF